MFAVYGPTFDALCSLFPQPITSSELMVFGGALAFCATWVLFRIERALCRGCLKKTEGAPCATALSAFAALTVVAVVPLLAVVVFCRSLRASVIDPHTCLAVGGDGRPGRSSC